VQPPDIEFVRQAVEVMGEEGVPSVGISLPHAEFGSRCGMAGLMMDIHDEPGLMDDLFDVEWQILDKHVEAFLAAPTEVGWLDICWATGSNLGPERFRRWALGDVLRAMAGDGAGAMRAVSYIRGETTRLSAIEGMQGINGKLGSGTPFRVRTTHRPLCLFTLFALYYLLHPLYPC